MKILKSLTTALLVLLYTYAVTAKLGDLDGFRGQLYNQTFPHALAAVLVYALPAAEIAVILLLLSPADRYGLWLSLGLLILFSSYIALVELHFWSRVPCSCGGILQKMGWTAHLVFNLFFIVINLIALRTPTGEAENLEQSRHQHT